ncbi:MAG: menaquinone biosynthesis protein [Candidatus Omnitrophica bacterium]|nr:menaquinone biosynthesis protein [Candidatus Omnitrophota bacterium]
MKSKIQVGAVPYLNSKPLVQGHESFLQEADFVFAPPSQLSRMIGEGLVDVALCSSIEYLRGGLDILPGVGVISRGAVNSVILTSEKPVEQAKTVNLDPSSLTSCALTGLWYWRFLKQDPQFSRYPVESPEAKACDAQLAIGDLGLQRAGRFAHQLDLGAAWMEWTGSPFVYAVWLVRQESVLGSIGKYLMDAPKRVHKTIPQLAVEASEELGLTNDLCVGYLTDSLQFTLDGEALIGLQRFLTLAAAEHHRLREIVPDLPALGVEIPVTINYHLDHPADQSHEA